MIKSGGAASTETTAGTEVGALIFVGVGGITVGVLGVKELDFGEAGLGFSLLGKGDVGDWGLVDIWFFKWCWEGGKEGEISRSKCRRRVGAGCGFRWWGTSISGSAV